MEVLAFVGLCLVLFLAITYIRYLMNVTQCTMCRNTARCLPYDICAGCATCCFLRNQVLLVECDCKEPNNNAYDKERKGMLLWLNDDVADAAFGEELVYGHPMIYVPPGTIKSLLGVIAPSVVLTRLDEIQQMHANMLKALGPMSDNVLPVVLMKSRQKTTPEVLEKAREYAEKSRQG